ncbi:hypothetical protein OAG56_06640, partial [Mariniblastus sp.]
LMLKESCDLEYLLIGDMRTLLSEDFDLQTRASLLILLNRLIRNLPNVLKLALDNSYLNAVLKRRPNWSRQIKALYQANMVCVSLVRDRLEKDTSIDAISKEVEQRLRHWIESLATIRCRESTMLQEAFALDLGGEA